MKMKRIALLTALILVFLAVPGWAVVTWKVNSITDPAKVNTLDDPQKANAVTNPTPGGDSWVCPMGKEDDDWTNTENAYDDDLGTAARCSTNGLSTTLTLPDTLCDKVRVHAGKVAGGQTDLKIEVYYSGGFHEIHDGLVTEDAWQEIAIGSTQAVSKARITLQTALNSEMTEFNFNFLGFP